LAIASVAFLTTHLFFFRFKLFDINIYSISIATGILFSIIYLSTKPHKITLNRFSLLSGGPNKTTVVDYSNIAFKDNYPVSTYRFNSDGYRDIEQKIDKSRRQILLVGDSYVHGDGIPSLAGTLMNQLRIRLGKKYQVINAAYPGFALYGYFETIKRTYEAYRPDLVIVGYLDRADWDPFDPQSMVDSLPANRYLRNLILNSESPQWIHESSVSTSSFAWESEEIIHKREKILNSMKDFSTAKKIPVILFHYSGKLEKTVSPVLPGIFLPVNLTYKFKSDKFWYAKDNHPKSLLNKAISEILEKEIRKHF